MTKLFLDFEWPVATSYQAIAGRDGEPGVTKLTGEQVTDRIEAVGPERFRRRPTEANDVLYLAFMQMPATLGDCRNFASNWGLLRTEKTDGVSETLADWRGAIERMKVFVSQLTKIKEGKAGAPGLYSIYEEVGFPVSDVEAVLRPRPSDGQMAIALRPKSLLEAMYLQAAQSKASGRDLKTCQECSGWFEAGADAPRRADAVFCSDPCKNKMHNRMKAKVKKGSAA